MKSFFSGLTLMIISLAGTWASAQTPTAPSLISPPLLEVEIRASSRSTLAFPSIPGLKPSTEARYWKDSVWSPLVRVLALDNTYSHAKRDGSGFVIGKFKDSLNHTQGVVILTDYHVLPKVMNSYDPDKELIVQFFNQQTKQLIVRIGADSPSVRGVSVWTDLALLYVPLKQEEMANIILPPLYLGDPDPSLLNYSWKTTQFKINPPELQSTILSYNQRRSTGNWNMVAASDAVNALAIGQPSFWYISEGFDQGMSGGPLISEEVRDSQNLRAPELEGLFFGALGFIFDTETKQGVAYPLGAHFLRMVANSVTQIVDSFPRSNIQSKAMITLKRADGSLVSIVDLNDSIAFPSITKFTNLAANRIQDNMYLMFLRSEKTPDGVLKMNQAAIFVQQIAAVDLSSGNVVGSTVGSNSESIPGGEGSGSHGGEGSGTSGGEGTGSHGGEGTGSHGGEGTGSSGGEGTGSSGGNTNSHRKILRAEYSIAVLLGNPGNTRFLFIDGVASPQDPTKLIPIKHLKELLDLLIKNPALTLQVGEYPIRNPEQAKRLARGNLKDLDSQFDTAKFSILLESIQNFPNLGPVKLNTSPSVQGRFIGVSKDSRALVGTLVFNFRDSQTGTSQNLEMRLGFERLSGTWKLSVLRFSMNGVTYGPKASANFEITPSVFDGMGRLRLRINGLDLGTIGL